MRDVGRTGERLVDHEWEAGDFQASIASSSNFLLVYPHNKPQVVDQITTHIVSKCFFQIHFP